jgi:hypothetical protein
MTLRSLRVIVLFLAVAMPLQLVVSAAAQQARGFNRGAWGRHSRQYD